MHMKLHALLATAAALAAAASCSSGPKPLAVTPSESDLQFESLATRWDEAVPLGNATIGALVWQKDSALRMSLDRTDLWDLRPMDSLAGPRYSFDWVLSKIKEGDYAPVQEKFDWPYNREPAPSKIPGAALEFLGISSPSDSVRLYINNALCEARWDDGTTLRTFVSADKPVGWFRFDHVSDSIMPMLREPSYTVDASEKNGNDQAWGSLARLGYEQGTIERTPNSIVYHQPGYGDFCYDVAVKWVRADSTLTGVWSVTSSMAPEKAAELCDQALERGIDADYDAHMAYWDAFWKQSSVTVPDPALQKQYDNEMYKLGSAARSDSYPISLQAVWTADNGSLPPWKGDYHHDLNTQLSYWPVYAGNHLDEGMGYLNTLWDQRDTYKAYTKQYFGTEGMNVPGVCTLTGEPMGGWIQYSMSPTCGAWLAHHFYLHWLYSADDDFLAEKAYPFAKDVATYLEQISYVDDDGVRQLPASSSPEMHDNSLNAWFPTMTNYDNALMRALFAEAADMADALGLADESERWTADLASMPAFDVDDEKALTIAQGLPYQESHRHFSHAMALYPLELIDVADSPQAAEIVNATIKRLTDVGPDYWTGYSYSWLANLQARARNGEGARDALRIFAECFCLPNTFHANGDQSGTGKSRFTYRPFTLEGNFAFAGGVQEMLMQSHRGMIEVFPAIPSDWADASFSDLRARGAFLVSAAKENGKVTRIEITSEKGKPLRLLLPEEGMVIKGLADYTITDGILSAPTTPGQRITLTNKQ